MSVLCRNLQRKTAKVRGFTLIEVLVSLILFAIMLVGLDTMQVSALREIRQTVNFSLAAEQLTNLAERLRALGTLQGRSKQIFAWNSENARLLPEGRGLVSGNYPQITAVIYWGGATGNCKQARTGDSGCLREQIQLASV